MPDISKEQFERWLKSLSVEELIAVSSGIVKQVNDLNEESRVVTEHLTEQRIARQKARFSRGCDGVAYFDLQ